MPSFQSPVPISGRPWPPSARLWSRPRAQCSNRVAVSSETVGWKKLSCSPACQPLAFQERDHLVENGGIAGRVDIVGDRVGEPRAIVGDPRAHALAGMRQPPMLHVAFDELPRRRAQQVLARHGRARVAASAMPSCS